MEISHIAKINTDFSLFPYSDRAIRTHTLNPTESLDEEQIEESL